jgi:hypothetical protein
MSRHNPATDPPGAVSDQNGEEAESGHRDDGKHPEPRTRDQPIREQDVEDAASGKREQDVEDAASGKHPRRRGGKRAA